jgi:hypothetical protein
LTFLYSLLHLSCQLACRDSPISNNIVGAHLNLLIASCRRSKREAQSFMLSVDFSNILRVTTPPAAAAQLVFLGSITISLQGNIKTHMSLESQTYAIKQIQVTLVISGRHAFEEKKYKVEINSIHMGLVFVSEFIK